MGFRFLSSITYLKIFKLSWLTRSRVLIYSCIPLALFSVLLAMLIYYADFHNPAMGWLFMDFRAAWSASYLAEIGRAQDAYSPTTLNSVSWVLEPFARYIDTAKYDSANIAAFIYWIYPPTYLLILFPIAYLPWLYSLVFYLATTLTLYLFALWKQIADPVIIVALLAFPAVWLNIRLGQNGFLVAGLLGFGLLFLKERPKIAGIFFGILCIKPHLALIIPIALIAMNAWSTIAIATFVALTLSFASLLILGEPSWEGWFNSLNIARGILENRSFHWVYSPSVYASIRLAGGSIVLAYIVQLLCTLLVVLVVWRIWKNSSSWPIKQGVVALACLLCSPYVYDYDLCLAGLAIVFFIRASRENGWLDGEKIVLVAVWLLPLIMIPVATFTSIQVGPLILLPMLLMFYRKSTRDKKANIRTLVI